ncbi:MAG: dimethylarginine dimethylaminohydrolase family protein [Candidatus Heimdallarchaeaceae archaeon]
MTHMKAKRALVREPSLSFTQCVSSHPLHYTVSLKRAKQQHANYCDVLSNLGLEIIRLPPKKEYPDSCFVEDTAVVSGDRAFITRMGVQSRRGEDQEVEEVLKEYFNTKRATAPATLEGGDVLHLPDRLICGITQRTNELGTKQMEDWLQVKVDTIINPNIVHLKSYMKYLGNNALILGDEYVNHPLLKGLDLLIIPMKESYSVNCLSIGNTIIMSNLFSYAQKVVIEAGFEVISLEMSEFEKCQGALTCLSILF